MFKDLSVQFSKALRVLVIIAVILLGAFVATGRFHVDTETDVAIGIYASALAGLPAYYNSGIWTITVLEMVSLFLLPIVLLIGRRYIKPLRDVSVMPWAVVNLAVLLAVFLWPNALAVNRRDAFDPAVSSMLPYFLQAQVPLAAGLVLGYGFLAAKIRIDENSGNQPSS